MLVTGNFMHLLVLVVTSWVQGVASLSIVNIEIKNLLKMQQGIGWPHALIVAEGNEALLRIDRSLESQRSCKITTPSGVTFNVQSPPNKRYTKWSDGCGVRIQNVAKTDEGRWRLTAINNNNTVTGWTEIYVEKSKTSYKGTPISIKDGEMKAKVELTSLDNSYCFVSKPFTESSLVPGHCSVTLDRTTRAIQGNWNILLGLPGQVTELKVQRLVTVESERLDVGYIKDHSENKLHLYCNILHTSMNITFCRFQKTTESIGYNVMDGLSDGRYSYYGKGFAHKQCGITIENPTSQEHGTWRCSIGLQKWVGTDIEPHTPMQALISVAPNSRYTRGNSKLSGSGENMRTVFVQEKMSFTIMCRADVSLAYCWFQHPNGTQFTPGAFVHEEQPFWYTGESLQTGDCGITFAHVTSEDAGKWACHMGPRDQLGVEETENILLRVTGPLAANEKEVQINADHSATLYCHTANGNRPLEYCRFRSPNYIGIRIDETVTKNNKILDRFYFTPNRSLDYGDCSLTINPVIDEDIGEWTCAALINEGVLEARDYISLHKIVPTTRLTTAGILGMSVGLVVLVLVLAGVLVYKRFRLRLPWRRQSPSTVLDEFSMNTNPSIAGSLNSNESNEM